MPAKILDGEALAKRIRLDAAGRVKKFAAKNGFAPGLAVVLVGKNPASLLYVGKKEEACRETGIKSFKVELGEKIPEKELLREIEKLNKDKKVHGILVQLPLPEHIDQAKITEAVLPEKDVDGFTSANMGRLFAGLPCIAPCTPLGIIRLIESTGIETKGKHAVVVGRSLIVGRPTAVMLCAKDCTVTVCHRHTQNLAQHTKQADILVTAVGKAGLITESMVKEGAVVVDAGTIKENGRTVGDVDFGAVKGKASWITPVPGGVGPMTVACLMENTLKAAEMQVGKGQK